MSTGATGEITMTERPEVLKQLRRSKRLVKDAKSGREFYETTYNGYPLRFSPGYSVTLPLDVVKALSGFGGNSDTGGGYGTGEIVPIQEECVHCQGKGFRPEGVCFHCKGRKLSETGEVLHIFKMLSEQEPMNFDNPIEKKILHKGSVKEAAESLTGAS